MIDRLRTQWLRRRERKLGEAVVRHRNAERALGLRAWDIDALEEPMRWARLINAARWQGHFADEAYKALEAVRAKIKQLEVA